MPIEIDGGFENVSRAEKVYRVLQEQILRGNIAPGEKLDILELSKQLAVSRTPVKEAFNRLALEGLVEIHPQRGTFVTTITENDIRQVSDLRLMMELWGLRAGFQHADHMDTSTLKAALKECESLLASSDEFNYYAFTQQDMRFHKTFVRASQNPRLEQTYRSLNTHMQLMRVYWGHARDRAIQSHVEHRAILDSFLAGEEEICREALRVHILRSRDDMVEFFRSQNSSEPTEAK